MFLLPPLSSMQWKTAQTRSLPPDRDSIFLNISQTSHWTHNRSKNMKCVKNPESWSPKDIHIHTHLRELQMSQQKSIVVSICLSQNFERDLNNSLYLSIGSINSNIDALYCKQRSSMQSYASQNPLSTIWATHIRVLNDRFYVVLVFCLPRFQHFRLQRCNKKSLIYCSILHHNFLACTVKKISLVS